MTLGKSASLSSLAEFNLLPGRVTYQSDMNSKNMVTEKQADDSIESLINWAVWFRTQAELLTWFLASIK